MRGQDITKDRAAFTLLELLAVIGVAALILVIFLPAIPRRPYDARNTKCLMNQRQAVLGLLMFASDYGGKYPWQVSTNHQGSMEFADLGNVTPHYQAFSNYFREPRILLCPTETKRTVATNLASATDANISYFLHLTAIPTNAQSPLLGDRHLAVNGRAVGPGLLTLNSNQAITWTRELHNKSSDYNLGCVAFADGHAETFRSPQRYSKSFPALTTNRFVLP